MPRALITGITGQDGPILAGRLLALGYDVHGLVRGQNNARRPAIESALPDLRFVEADLLDAASLIRAIAQVQPDEIYHLAATRQADDAIGTLTGEVTAIGTERLLEAVRIVESASPSRASSVIRIVSASTGEVFGDPYGLFDERSPLAPRSAYAIAKAYAHQMVVHARDRYGMYACNAILFDHIASTADAWSPATLIAQAAYRITQRIQNELRIADRSGLREWADARDHMRAMHLMLQQPTPRDLVIATGARHSVRDVVDAIFARFGIDASRYVVTDPRGVAIAPRATGDASLAGRAINWRPEFMFGDTIASLVESALGADTPRRTVRRSRRANVTPSVEPAPTESRRAA